MFTSVPSTGPIAHVLLQKTSLKLLTSCILKAENSLILRCTHLINTELKSVYVSPRLVLDAFSCFSFMSSYVG